MALKSYNLVEGHAGEALMGNWYEDRQWKGGQPVSRGGHGLKLTAQPGYEEARFESTYTSSYRPPEVLHAAAPPRAARLVQRASETVSRAIADGELQAEDKQMYFTRGRYLEAPKPYGDNPDTSAVAEPAITIYSQRAQQKGRDSHFTEPIDDYLGHRKVKDD